MKEQIKQYEPKSQSVVALGERRVRAFVGDETPRLGSVLWVGNTPTRIVSLAGARRVESIAFDVEGLAVGDPVRCSDDDAGWPAARTGVTRLEDLAFEPGRASAPRTRTAPVQAAGSVAPPFDAWLPLPVNGVMIVLDCGADDEVFDALLGTVLGDAPQLVVASQREVRPATYQVLGDGYALAVAVDWSRELGAARLLESEPFDLDTLLDADDGLTTVVRVHLTDGLDVLAETLDLGNSDTQIVLQADGRIDLARSESRLRPANITTDVLRVPQIREQLQLFGEHEVDPEDLALLESVDALERVLID